MQRASSGHACCMLQCCVPVTCLYCWAGSRLTPQPQHRHTAAGMHACCRQRLHGLTSMSPRGVWRRWRRCPWLGYTMHSSSLLPLDACVAECLTYGQAARGGVFDLFQASKVQAAACCAGNSCGRACQQAGGGEGGSNGGCHGSMQHAACMHACATQQAILAAGCGAGMFFYGQTGDSAGWPHPGSRGQAAC